MKKYTYTFTIDLHTEFCKSRLTRHQWTVDIKTFIFIHFERGISKGANSKNKMRQTFLFIPFQR